MTESTNEEIFDKFFEKIVMITCEQWDYELPRDEYYINVYKRLPLGLRNVIASGLVSGIVKTNIGLTKKKSAAFRPIGVSEKKGPYAWFERNNQTKQPQPCWEYFIQLAEYIRLYEVFQNKDTTLSFEDELMDIGIYKNNKLWAYCETKNKVSEAQNLIDRLKELQDKDQLTDFDRGNDPLRKAKYIVKLKPEYFYVVAIGRRFEFRVEYPQNMQFKLVEDFVPV